MEILIAVAMVIFLAAILFFRAKGASIRKASQPPDASPSAQETFAGDGLMVFVEHTLPLILTAPALAATGLWVWQAWQWIKTAHWPVRAASHYIEGSKFKFEGLIGWNNTVDAALAISAVKFGFTLSGFLVGITVLLLFIAAQDK